LVFLLVVGGGSSGRFDDENEALAVDDFDASPRLQRPVSARTAPGLRNSNIRPYTPISINMKATFGSVMTASSSVRQSAAAVTASSPAVAKRSAFPATFTVRPSILRRRSGTSSAITSMT
jgi:hypothetical protein